MPNPQPNSLPNLYSPVTELRDCALKVATDAEGDMRLASASESFEALVDLVSSIVDAEDDQVLDLARELLRTDSYLGDEAARVALDCLDWALKAAVVSQTFSVEAGDLDLKLLPMILPENLELIPAAVYGELLAVWGKAEQGNLYFLDPRLWTDEGLYCRSYLELAGLDPAQGGAPDYPDVDEPDEDVAVLRYLAIWSYRDVAPHLANGEHAESDEQRGARYRAEVLEGIRREMREGVRTIREEAHTAFRRTGEILSVLLEGPVIADEARDVLQARALGWVLVESVMALDNLDDQLAMPRSATTLHMVVSAHGQPFPPETGIDHWDLQEARVGVLDQNGVLIARHSIRLAPWFRYEDALDLMPEVAERLGAVSIHEVSDRVALETDRPGEPVYFQGKGFLTGYSAAV